MCSCCLPRPRRCTVVVRFLARFLAWLRAAARARTQKSGRRAASAAFLNGKSRSCACCNFIILPQQAAVKSRPAHLKEDTIATTATEDGRTKNR